MDHDLARQCVHGSLGPQESDADDNGSSSTQVFVNPRASSVVATASANKQGTNDDEDDDDDEKAKKIALAKEAKNKAKITGTEKLERG